MSNFCVYVELEPYLSGLFMSKVVLLQSILLKDRWKAKSFILSLPNLLKITTLKNIPIGL